MPPSVLSSRPWSGSASRPVAAAGRYGSPTRVAADTDRVADDTVARMTESATIIPAERLQAKREERERERQQREAMAGSILGLLDEDDHPSAPASRAEHRKPTQ